MRQLIPRVSDRLRCWFVPPPSPPQDGLTPLLCSAKHGHADVCAALLDCGADINACDGAGRYQESGFRLHESDPPMLKTGMCRFLRCRTALMLASESNAASTVDVLIQRGADLSSLDSQGHDVGHYAKLSASPEIKTALNRQISGRRLGTSSGSCGDCSQFTH